VSHSKLAKIPKVLLCHGPWSNQTNQFELLAFFVKELGIELENEDNKFVYPPNTG
jgi:hypothetical protein